MNPTSPLQQQFPLSPKKFTKKMINQIIPILFMDILFGGFAGAMIIAALLALKLLPDPMDPIVAVVGFLAYFVFIFIVLTFIYAWYIKVYIKRYYYSGEDHYITIKKGVFAPKEIHVQYQKIQDVYVDQDIIDRIMGLYDVHIASATAASGMEAHIDGVELQAAEGLKKFFLDKMIPGGQTTGSVSQGVPPPSSNQASMNSPRPSTFSFTEEISSEIYPLTSKWMKIQVIKRLLAPLVTWGIIALAIVPRMIVGVNFSSDNFIWVLIIWLGIGLLSSIWSVVSLYLWRKNYAFHFTPENVYYKDGVIALSEKHMPYSSIQDVSVQQGVLERFVGLASVRIENAASGQMVTVGRGAAAMAFSGVVLQGLTLEDANKITDMLKTTVLNSNTSRYGL